MSAPIDPVKFVHGVNVVDIGDLRVARGRARRHFSACDHLNLVYDMTERRVHCQDCESEVEPFDAFEMLVRRFHVFEAKHRALKETAEATIISRAARKLDEAFRSRKMAPACPHCNAAILPEDVANGVAMVSKELEVARRKRHGK